VMIDFRIVKEGGTIYCILLGDKHGGYIVERLANNKRDAVKARNAWRRKWHNCDAKNRAEIIQWIAELSIANGARRNWPFWRQATPPERRDG